MANSISHVFGILLGILASYFLFKKALSDQNGWIVISVAIYLIGMLSSYVASSYYHYLPAGKKKSLLQKLDHAAIYLHIAGTYTPLIVATMSNNKIWGYSILVFVWTFALIGIIASFKKSGKHSYIETICYVVMGCTILVAFKPLIEVLSNSHNMPVLWWLIAGGAFFIIGAAFYSLAKIKYMHTIFHFFVLAGSVCHIISIYLVI